MNRKVGLGILAAIVFIGVLAYLTVDSKRHRAEVCVAFGGRSSCRTASGATREQAIRTATDNACALVASGMTDTIACGQAPPTSVRVLD